MGSNEEIIQLLQKTQTIFKQTQRDKEEKYLNDIIQLQDKIKDLENVVCKMGRSTDTLRLLTNEQKAFRDNLRNVSFEGNINQPFGALEEFRAVFITWWLLLLLHPFVHIMKIQVMADQEIKIETEVKEIRKSFYCELCNKQYKLAVEFEGHLSSYDHNHRK
ncbi:G patch domain-containing protein 8 [Tanacetum coccineum]